jgi:hypothetical protein
MLNDDALKIRYFLYHSYVELLIFNIKMEIDPAGIKTLWKVTAGMKHAKRMLGLG